MGPLKGHPEVHAVVIYANLHVRVNLHSAFLVRRLISELKGQSYAILTSVFFISKEPT